MNEAKMTPEEKVKRAFPDSEWEWWYIANPNGTIGYLAIVYTASRTVLGQAMNHSMTIAQQKAYKKAAKHPHVSGWHTKIPTVSGYKLKGKGD